jgi:hypothetical protein
VSTILFLLAVGVPPAPLVEAQANSCGNPSLFAFPMAPKQGDQVTVFVTVTNNTGTDASFVVDSHISDPGSAVALQDDRVVAVSANSSASFQLTFSSSAANRTGAYTVKSRSYVGDTLPVCSNCFCSTTTMLFTLGCNSNNC